MRLSFRKLSWPNFRRRLCSGLLLIAYVVAAIGYPLPASAVGGACGQQVCGCGTPEQCKASGCGCPHGGNQQEETAPNDDDETPSCCSKKKTPPKSSCCSTKPDKKNPAPKPKPVRWVVGIAAMKCRGGGTEWMTAQPALPGPAPTDWQPGWPFCHALAIAHHYPFVRTEDLRDPPPRFAAV